MHDGWLSCAVGEQGESSAGDGILPNRLGCRLADPLVSSLLISASTNVPKALRHLPLLQPLSVERQFQDRPSSGGKAVRRDGLIYPAGGQQARLISQSRRLHQLISPVDPGWPRGVPQRSAANTPPM